ncbi:MAG: hypothetical protein ACSLFP_18440 [Acidimicrobiales bacterium]
MSAAGEERAPARPDPEALAGLRAAAEDTWERAIRHHHHRADLLVAGLRVRVELAGRHLSAAVLPALEVHRSTDGPPQVRIRAYDAAETGAPAPMDPGGMARHIARWSVDPQPGAGPRWTWNDTAGLLLLSDPAGVEQVAAVTDAATLPPWELAAPLRQLFAWGMAPAGRTFVHAGAVGDPDGVALLVGAGGSGKTTTAISCFLAGMGYLGDDYVVLTEAEGQIIAHALYGSAKVHPDQLSLADPSGSLLPHLLRPAGGADDRAVLLPGRSASERMLSAAPVRAIVVPTVAPPRGLTPISAAEALRHLAPSSLFQLAGAGDDDLRALADLVRTVPCHRLGLHPDRAANPPFIASLLAAA